MSYIKSLLIDKCPTTGMEVSAIRDSGRNFLITSKPELSMLIESDDNEGARLLPVYLNETFKWYFVNGNDTLRINPKLISFQVHYTGYHELFEKTAAELYEEYMTYYKDFEEKIKTDPLYKLGK